MLLKSADDKTKDIQALEALLKHPGAGVDVRSRIEREIMNIRSGIRGEQETAYELDFSFKNRNWIVIHDLRIEHDGFVAQLDHVLINRFMAVYVCESKRFSEGVSINENGEFVAYFKHRPYGIPSPIEQNRRHTDLLAALFKAGVVQLPRRLGFKLKPELHSYVLVSKGARIGRPKALIPGLDRVLKTDQFVSRLSLEMANDNVLEMARLISQDTLEAFARQLVDLHTPIQVDWASKFGLQDQDLAAPSVKAAPAITAQVSQPIPVIGTAVASEKSKLICADCTVPVSYAVAKFCWSNRRFGGAVYCMACQKNH